MKQLVLEKLHLELLYLIKKRKIINNKFSQIPVQRKIHVYNPSNADIIFDTIITLDLNFHYSSLEIQVVSYR